MIKQRTLHLTLIPVLFGVLVLSTGLLVKHQQVRFEQAYIQETRSEMKNQVQTMVQFLVPLLEVNDLDGLDRFCETFAFGQRSVSLFDHRGNAVIASNNADLRAMKQNRPEIRQATEGKPGLDVRTDERTGLLTVYAATSITIRNHKQILHLSCPAESIGAIGQRSRVLVGIIALVGILFLTLLSWYIYWDAYLPLNRLQSSAERIANGELSTMVEVPSRGSVRELAEAVDRMAGQLRLELDSVRRQELLRREFVANLSHEIKTPLTGILAVIQLMEEDGQNDPALLTRCRSILFRQTNRLQTLVSDVLKLAEAERIEETNPDWEYVRLDQAMFDAVEMCRSQADNAGIDITILAAVPVKVAVPVQGSNPTQNTGDRKLLELTITSLITNAIKYSGSDSIELTLTHEGENAVLNVRDYGIGIPEKLYGRVFERFYRVRSTTGGSPSTCNTTTCKTTTSSHVANKPEGSGLGLAIVKHTIKALRGTVALTSHSGPGCWFTITLPCESVSQDEGQII